MNHDGPWGRLYMASGRRDDMKPRHILGCNSPAKTYEGNESIAGFVQAKSDNHQVVVTTGHSNDSMASKIREIQPPTIETTLATMTCHHC